MKRPSLATDRRSRIGVIGGLVATLAATAPAAGQALPSRMTIEEAENIALGRHPELRIAQANADAAGADRRATFGAFLPNVQGSLNFSRNSFTNSTFINPDGTTEILDDPVTSISQGAGQSLNFSWDVLRGGNRFAELRRSSSTVRAQQRRLDDQRRTVIREVRTAYYTALRSQRLIELAERQREDRRLDLEVSQRRWEIAAVDRTDVLTAESNLIAAELEVLSQRKQFADAMNGVAVAIGMPPDATRGMELADVADPPSLGTTTAAEFAARAATSDPEIAALDAERSAASASLWASRTNYLPTISLSYSLSRSESLTEDDPFFVFNPANDANNFAVSLSWTLFDGFQRERQTAQASADRRRAEQQMIRRRQEVERDVQQFVNEIRRLEQSLDLSERRLAIEQERLQMTRARYQSGEAEFVSLQQAIDGVTAAEQTRIQQRFDYLQAWADLQQYIDPRS